MKDSEYREPFKYFSLRALQTPHSFLLPIECKDYFSFEVKRLYYMTNATGDTGAHCHYREKEFFLMIQGYCTAIIDRGNGLEEFLLEGSNSAIYVANYVWHGFKDFSQDAILLALSSTNYRADRSDYLEDYATYLNIQAKFLKQKEKP